jgi:hypothetical protein
MDKSIGRFVRNLAPENGGSRIDLGIEPLEVEEWLTTLKKEEVATWSCRWSIGMANNMARFHGLGNRTQCALVQTQSPG